MGLARTPQKIVPDHTAIPRSNWRKGNEIEDTSYPEPTGIKFGTNEIGRDQTYLTLNQQLE
jgi:hypothetical protein